MKMRNYTPGMVVSRAQYSYVSGEQSPEDMKLPKEEKG